LKISGLFSRNTKLLLGLTVFVLFWVVVLKIASGFIISQVNNNWGEIYEDNVLSRTDLSQKLFKSTLDEVSSLSLKLGSNLEIRKNLNSGDSRKIFEEILKDKISPISQIEIYNKWSDLVAFDGRQLNPDFLSLQSSLKGNSFSQLKEVGFYTFLMQFTPVKDFDDDKQIIGVVITGKIIDVKYRIKNKFFPEYGFISELSKLIGNTVSVIPTGAAPVFSNTDTASLQGNIFVNLKGTDDKIIGKIVISGFDKNIHIQNIVHFTNRILSVLIFASTLLFLFLVLRFIKLFHSELLKLLIFSLYLIAVRYLWIIFEFPSKIVENDIFSPVYFASSFGGGIIKSLGDLFLTSVFVFAFAVFSSKLAYDSLVFTKQKFTLKRKMIRIIYSLGLVYLFFLILDLYGTAISSIIFESNIKFLDKTGFFPGTELLFVQLVILVLTLAFLMLSSACILVVFSGFKNISLNKNYKKYVVYLVFIVFVVVNSFNGYLFGNSNILYLHRLIILILLLFSAYM